MRAFGYDSAVFYMMQTNAAIILIGVVLILALPWIFNLRANRTCLLVKMPYLGFLRGVRYIMIFLILWGSFGCQMCFGIVQGQIYRARGCHGSRAS